MLALLYLLALALLIDMNSCPPRKIGAAGGFHTLVFWCEPKAAVAATGPYRSPPARQSVAERTMLTDHYP